MKAWQLILILIVIVILIIVILLFLQASGILSIPRLSAIPSSSASSMVSGGGIG